MRCKRKGLFFLLCVLMQMGCSVIQKKDSEKGPRVHNIAPAFIEYWSSVESLPVSEQVEKLKANFFPKFPEFYKYKVEKWKKTGKNPNREIESQLLEFPKIKNEFVKKTEEISEKLESTLNSFVASVPGLDRDFDVYITHSFGDMDGGTRKIGDKIYFILGIDGMVKYHKGFESEVPFFHHELFHVYHGQYLTEEQVMWVALWAEGLATYASKKLNPSASLKDLMLDLPEGMVSDIDGKIDSHWSDLKKKLESKKDQDYESYFLLSSKNKRITTRAGYYLGYLLAKEIGKRKSIPEMAQMDPKEILPLLEETIETVSSAKR